MMTNGRHPQQKNVLGGELETCCTDPMTGFYRNGRCETGVDDIGRHVICAQMTDEFLDFTRTQGNDLTTPAPGFRASNRVIVGACVPPDGRKRWQSVWLRQ